MRIFDMSIFLLLSSCVSSSAKKYEAPQRAAHTDVSTPHYEDVLIGEALSQYRALRGRSLSFGDAT